jgi:hypothetical protein
MGRTASYYTEGRDDLPPNSTVNRVGTVQSRAYFDDRCFRV